MKLQWNSMADKEPEPEQWCLTENYFDGIVAGVWDDMIRKFKYHYFGMYRLWEAKGWIALDGNDNNDKEEEL